MTSIIINDFHLGRRLVLVLDQSDFEQAQDIIDRGDPDEILLQLQNMPSFKGRTRLNDLTPFHFRLMITSNLTKMNEMPDSPVFDLNHPIANSLIYLLSSMVLCLEKRGECSIETMKINRIGEAEVSFEYSAVLMYEEPLPKRKRKKPKGTEPDPKPKKPGSISIVVDNT